MNQNRIRPVSIAAWFELMGAEIIDCKKDKVAETIEYVLDSCKKKGLKPYYINGNKYGVGNEKVAVSTIVEAYEEILDYEEEYSVFFDYVFVASGTGTNQAGLIC